MAIEDQARERLAPGIAGARLEVDEVARAEGRRPPGDERRRAARTRSGAARRSRGGGRRSGPGRPRRGSAGASEALPCPARIGAGVVADDPDLDAFLGASRIRWRVDLAIASKTSSRRLRPPSGSEIRWRDGWISSIWLEPGGLDRARGTRSRRRAPRGPPRRRRSRRPPGGSADGDQARRQCLVAVGVDRSRPARDVRAAAADQRPRPGQREGPPAGVIDEEARPPARARSRWAAQARDW